MGDQAAASPATSDRLLWRLWVAPAARGQPAPAPRRGKLVTTWGGQRSGTARRRVRVVRED